MHGVPGSGGPSAGRILTWEGWGLPEGVCEEYRTYEAVYSRCTWHWVTDSLLHHATADFTAENPLSHEPGSHRMAGHTPLLNAGAQLCDPQQMHRVLSMEKAVNGSNEGYCHVKCWVLPGGLKGKTSAPNYKIPPGSILPKRKEWTGNLRRTAFAHGICSAFAEVKLGPRTPKLGGPLVHDSCTVVVHVPLCLDVFIYKANNAEMPSCLKRFKLYGSR